MGGTLVPQGSRGTPPGGGYVPVFGSLKTPLMRSVVERHTVERSAVGPHDTPPRVAPYGDSGSVHRRGQHGAPYLRGYTSAVGAAVTLIKS